MKNKKSYLGFALGVLVSLSFMQGISFSKHQNGTNLSQQQASYVSKHYADIAETQGSGMAWAAAAGALAVVSGAAVEAAGVTFISGVLTVASPIALGVGGMAAL